MPGSRKSLCDLLGHHVACMGNSSPCRQCRRQPHRLLMMDHNSPFLGMSSWRWATRRIFSVQTIVPIALAGVGAPAFSPDSKELSALGATLRSACGVLPTPRSGEAHRARARPHVSLRMKSDGRSPLVGIGGIAMLHSQKCAAQTRGARGVVQALGVSWDGKKAMSGGSPEDWTILSWGLLGGPGRKCRSSAPAEVFHGARRRLRRSRGPSPSPPTASTLSYPAI